LLLRRLKCSYFVALVRQKAKDITALLTDEARLKEERRTRSAMHDRMSGRTPGEGRHNYNATTPTYERPGANDDDRDLQRALEESRRMARESQGDNRYRENMFLVASVKCKDMLLIYIYFLMC
jgi:hypothetical protein